MIVTVTLSPDVTQYKYLQQLSFFNHPLLPSTTAISQTALPSIEMAQLGIQQVDLAPPPQDEDAGATNNHCEVLLALLQDYLRHTLKHFR